MDPFGLHPPNQRWNQGFNHRSSFFQPYPQKKGFNFLQKILGKNQYGYAPRPPFGFGPGIAPKYSQIHGTINHIQKGLHLVQQVSPYIKQYGPYIKNFPMILDMIKIMMENEDEEDFATQEQDHAENESIDSNQIKKVKSKKQGQQKKDNDHGIPQPKLYI